MSEFRLADRGFEETLLVIPGWAFDYRIFDRLDLDYNYLFPISYSPSEFGVECRAALIRYGIRTISVFGWSMGAILACDLIREYGDIEYRDIFLVGARTGYRKKEIETVKGLIAANRRAYLYKFYKDCFFGNERDAYLYFRKSLLNSYLFQFELKLLDEGLDYLLNSALDFERLRDLEVTFLHGEKDRIAPLNEIFEFKSKLRRSRFITFSGAGHIPFINPGFRDIFYAG